MPPPKSPLDKPARKPGHPRRSSSDKSILASSDKHGVKATSHSTSGRSKDSHMPSTSLSKATEMEREKAGGEVSDDGKSADTPLQSSNKGKAIGASHEQSLVSSKQQGQDTGPEVPQAEEVERLRAAMNAQLQLTQHREKLTRQLGEIDSRGGMGSIAGSGKSRVSPIHEEVISPSIDAAFDSPLTSAPGTASTDSVQTVRGGFTPAAVRTPSYPFPSMRTPGPYAVHRPFTALSPTVNPSNFGGGSFGEARDQVPSSAGSPLSPLNFQPPGLYEQPEDPSFPTPNLYELSLKLSAEPGLDAWWTTVVDLMRTLYKADRVTLSVPADATDVENVPWGQKATFNAIGEDELSLSYLPRGSSLVTSSAGTNETSNSEETNNNDDAATNPMLDAIRPGLISRHSFTSYEDTKRDARPSPEAARAARPVPLTRAKSYLSARPDPVPRTATLHNTELSLQSLKDHMDFEAARTSSWEDAQPNKREVQGRVFSVLQALDYESDPLIDSSGILKVLERGKVIALTRDYPYLDEATDEKSGGSATSKRSGKSAQQASPESAKKTRPEISSRISSFFGSKSSKRSTRNVHTASDKGKSIPGSSRICDDPPHTIPRYDEYEQTPPSPWAQSPSPSPAVRAETSENPFFMDSNIDEETFIGEEAAAEPYRETEPIEAIGVDRSWTVLHIPLTHPLLSKPVQSFRLDATALGSKSTREKGQKKSVDNSKPTTYQQTQEKRTPIAVISILSPVIPYPTTLRHSLEHLSPHLATSFSLCRHYSNLENEIAGLSRKRPQIAGFGAVATLSKPSRERLAFGNLSNPETDENLSHRNLGGSITSPSDYSAISRSTAGSPAGTPYWDPSSVGLLRERKSGGESPSYATGESYFNSKSRPSAARVHTSSGSSVGGARITSIDSSSAESRVLHGSRQTEETASQLEVPALEEYVGQGNLEKDEALSAIPRQDAKARVDYPVEPRVDTSENREPSPSRQAEHLMSPRRQAMRRASNQGTSKNDRTHTQLHSYGADFGATFQSLPTTSGPSSKESSAGHSRRDSTQTVPTSMPPPSDRLKGLMLDALPAHVFVALPQTGEIVWVNQRYLNYRGQTVAQLYEDPWGSIHTEDRDDYLKAWAHAIKTGEQFSRQVRIRRFDGTYRWFATRAVGSKDVRGVIVQWYGSHMDIHEQHVAEVKAARQEEIEASEAKHRQLANLIPQIIFSATEDEGVTFANEQWLSYTGQAFDDALGLGFMDYVHPEDLAKCHIPTDRPPTPSQPRMKKPAEPTRNPSQVSSGGNSSAKSSTKSDAPTETTVKGVHHSLSRQNSSSSSSMYEVPTADLSELARTGVIKVATDSTGRVSYTTEVRLRSKTGEYRWHLVRCVEVDNINLGSGDGSWFGACTDINDHKLLETKLKEAMESKSKFLSNMSHEIRTPLIGISGMVNFLQDTTLNDEQADYASTIAASASSLLNIINDILDLSKVDAGMMKLAYQWFHTRSLVEEVNEMVSTLAITKRLELNYVVDVDVPEMVKGDKFRIRQVLLNVIGNAIKFTTVGEVFTSCKVVVRDSAEQNEVMLEFSVIDTGRGFTEEEAQIIFKPFSQIDGSSTRQHGGSGLGLVISRQLVELHGGKMVGSAVPDKGSTFTFSAVFGLPTDDDHPEPPNTPLLTPSVSRTPAAGLPTPSLFNEVTARAMKQAGGNPILANKLMHSPAPISPMTESSITSSTMMSSGSSDPSLKSARSRTRSSQSSIPQSFPHFSEAAMASQPDLSEMKLALPEKRSSSGAKSVDSLRLTTTGPTPKATSGTISARSDSSSTNASAAADLKNFRPPMYSILIICPQKHSLEATSQHIEITLPKDVPHQITPMSDVDQAKEMIAGADPVVFTHVVLNLGSAEEIVTFIEMIVSSISLPETSIVVLSDPVQRQEVIKMASVHDYDQLAKDNRVRFVYKPVKPSRFAVIFDPDKERDLSTDKNRSTAQQQVADQRQNYLDAGKRLGNKQFKALLVEDNPVNQKVITRFLEKIGLDVELASDGVECTERVFSHPHLFYSLICCDIHMPRKDGFNTCLEIREWERKNKYPRMPIIALSANVMADIGEMCAKVGFNTYLTKPIDFKELGNSIVEILDPVGKKTSA